MQIDKHPLYPTMFILGHRMIAATPTKHGAVIVKGTFQDIDQPRLAEKQAPIFLKDVPFNFVRNSSFEAEEVKPWQATGGAIERIDDGIEEKSDQKRHALKFSSNGKSDRVIQKLTIDKPIGGRTFVLSFYAKAASSTTINGFLLKAVASGVEICRMSAALEPAFKLFIGKPETWPAALNDEKKDTEVEIILPGSGDKANPVYFDRIQVEETDTATRWDEDTVFRYEHDLAPFKPHADVIVLGAAEPPDGDRTHSWNLILKNEAGLKVQKKFDAITHENFHFHFPTKTRFGWAARGEGERKDQAGINLDQFNPKERDLPIGFNDLFYNGYDRALTGSVPLPYLNDGTRFKLSSVRDAPPAERILFEVQLPASRPTAILREQETTGEQTERNIPLYLDTVIIEPELDRYMVVWRGSWPFDENNKERYLKLSVAGGV